MPNSFIEHVESQQPKDFYIETSPSHTRKVNAAEYKESEFFRTYKDFPGYETLVAYWNQYKLLYSRDQLPVDTPENLWSMFYDTALTGRLLDIEYARLIGIAEKSKTAIKREAVSCYRQSAQGKEWVKYACKVIVKDKHDVEYFHTVANVGYCVLPKFKRSYDKLAEDFIESLEIVGQEPRFSIEYTKENLAALPVADESRYYLISSGENKKKYRVSKEQFYNDSEQTIIAHDRQEELKTITANPGKYQ